MRTISLLCALSLTLFACDNKGDAKTADAKVEVSKDGVKAPGVEVSKDGVKAPGVEVSADGVKAGEVGVDIAKDGSVKVTDGKSEVAVDAKGNTITTADGNVKVDGDKGEV